MTALRDTVKRLISDVYTGKLHPRTASGLAPLLHLQLRVIEKTDFEQRVPKVEKQLNRLKDQLQDPRVKAWREEERHKRNDEALGKRPAQAVKPYGSNDGKSLINHSFTWLKPTSSIPVARLIADVDAGKLHPPDRGRDWPL